VINGLTNGFVTVVDPNANTSANRFDTRNLAVDVPMYLKRWRYARSNGVRYLSMKEGVRDALQRRRIAHRWSEWRPEVPWMSLYFSVGVWLSLCLVFV